MISRNKLSIPHLCVINSVNIHWSSTHFSWFLRHDSWLLACWWDLWWPVHEQRPMMERKRLRDRSSCHKAWRNLQLTTFATCPRWIHMVLLSFELLAFSLAYNIYIYTHYIYNTVYPYTNVSLIAYDYVCIWKTVEVIVWCLVMHNWCQAPAGAFAGCFLLRTDKSRKESYGGVDDGLWNWENPANCTDFSQAFSSHVEWSKTWCKTRWTLCNCCAWFSPVSFRVMIIRLRCELHKMSGALAAFCFGACGCLPLVASVASTAEWSAPRGMGRTGIHRSTRGRRFREGQGRERYTRSIWQPPGSRDPTPFYGTLNHSMLLYSGAFQRKIWTASHEASLLWNIDWRLLYFDHFGKTFEWHYSVTRLSSLFGFGDV